MDYEKMYKDALSHAKQAYGTGAYDDSTLEAIFPELAESNDEKILASIADCVSLMGEDGDVFSNHNVTKVQVLSWLEKQKEQKPELPLMGGDTDTYFDDLRMTTKPLTSREWFNEGIKYAQRLQKEQHPSSRFLPGNWVVYDGPLGHAILQIKDVVGGRYSFVDNVSTLLEEDSDKFLRPLTPKDVEKPAEWKPQPESLEALMYAIEGKWDAISPTSYLSRRLEDLYEGLVNTYNVDESLLAELPKAASRAYTAEGIEELRELKRKIEASMEQKPVEKQDYSGLDDLERAILRGFLAAGMENVPVTIIKVTAKEFLAQMKPAEWSDEDEKIRKTLLDYYEKALDNYTCVEWLNGITYGELCDWLKSLRPSWKPSEEQMEVLLSTQDMVRSSGYRQNAKVLASLYEQLKRLM